MAIRAAAAALALAFGAPALAHEPQPATAAVPLAPDAAEAARTVDAFHAALKRGDAPAALAVLAEDAVIFESGGVERSRAEYAAEHLAADAAFAQAVPSTRLARTGRVEGPLAWIATDGRTTGSWRGKPVDRLTTETMLLRRRKGGWVVVHIHWASGAVPSGQPGR